MGETGDVWAVRFSREKRARFRRRNCRRVNDSNLKLSSRRFERFIIYGLYRADREFGGVGQERFILSMLLSNLRALFRPNRFFFLADRSRI